MLVFIMMVAVACVDVSGGSIRCSVSASASALCLESLRGRWRSAAAAAYVLPTIKDDPGEETL